MTIGPNGGINDKGHRLWWRSLNDFVFTLSLMSIEYETVVNLVATIAPEELTEFDLNTIDRAYVDGERLRD